MKGESRMTLIPIKKHVDHGKPGAASFCSDGVTFRVLGHPYEWYLLGNDKVTFTFPEGPHGPVIRHRDPYVYFARTYRENMPDSGRNPALLDKGDVLQINGAHYRVGYDVGFRPFLQKVTF